MELNAEGLQSGERDIAKFTVELSIAEPITVNNPTNEREEFDLRLQAMESVKLAELLSKRITLIIGVAGIGKSVLAKQIAFKWANNDELFTQFSHCVLIECRKLTAIEDLDKFLADEYFIDGGKLESKDILFVIDGLDEIENLQHELQIPNSNVHKLLHSNKFCHSKFILTGRPHVQGILRREVRQTFEVFGLSEQSIDDYIKMFAEDDNEKLAKINATRDSSANIQSTLRIPQYLNTLCCVSLMTAGQAIKSVTELYIWLLYIFLNEHVNKEDNEDVSAEDIFLKFSLLIARIAEISYDLVKNNRIRFRKKHFNLGEIEKDKAFRVFLC